MKEIKNFIYNYSYLIMRRLFILCYLSCIFTTLLAQGELKVKSFLPSVSDLTARIEVRNDNRGEPCALIKVVFADKDVSFECGNLASMIIGDVSFHTNEYWIYLAAGAGGAKHLKVKHPGYPTIDVLFANYGFSSLEPQTTYTLIIAKPAVGLSFSKYNQFYIDAFFQAGGLMGPGVTLGGHFHAVNAEVEICKELLKSSDVFWYDQNILFNQSTYSALSGNVKLGYGFRLGKKFLLTPQAGIGIVKCLSDGDNPGKDANSVYSMIGCRSSFVFAKHFQIVVAPYYNFAIKKSPSFEEISNVQSSINKWANGINIKVGLSAFF